MSIEDRRRTGSSARWAALFFLLLAVVWVPGCGGSRGEADLEAAKPRLAAGPKKGGTLVVGAISDIDSWNEYLSRQASSVDLLRRVYLRLARPLGDTRDHPPTFEPQLAESWASSDDGKTLTFRLRDCTWSDGKPITAQDVVFTWKAQVAPDVAWVAASSKERITAVEQGADARTVVFRFDRAYPDQMGDAVDGGILPEHVFGAVPFADWRTQDWSFAHVGSGPFLPERHEPGQEIALERNPRYFVKDAPLVDRVVVRIVPDASNLVTQLLAGGIDFLDGVPPREAARVGAAAGTKLLPYDEPKYDYLGWNGSKAPFSDPKVRAALTLAIDRKALVDDLLFGYGRVSQGPILSFWWGADREQASWPYDLEEAKRRLFDLGFRPGKDGTLARNGKPLAFEITTNAGNRLRESMLVKIQEQLARAGVRVAPVPLEMKTFMERNMSGKYDAYLGGWRFTGKIDLRSIFRSDQVPAKGGNNVVFFKSPEVDRLIDALDTASTWNAMVPTLRDVQRRIHDEAPYTFLYETQRIAAAGRRLHGARVDIPSDPLARLETWSVEP